MRAKGGHMTTETARFSSRTSAPGAPLSCLVVMTIASVLALTACGGGKSSTPPTASTTSTTVATTDVASENVACSQARQLSSDLKNHSGDWSTYAPYIDKIEADLLNNSNADGALRDKRCVYSSDADRARSAGPERPRPIRQRCDDRTHCDKHAFCVCRRRRLESGVARRRAAYGLHAAHVAAPERPHPTADRVAFIA